MDQQGLPVTDYMWELYDSPPDVDPAQTITRMVFPLQP